MKRQKALADEIQTWLKGGKRRNLITLQYKTGVHRNTLKAAAEGTAETTDYNTVLILSEVSTTERFKAFVYEFIPKFKPVHEKIAESTSIAAGNLSDIECKVLADVVFEDPAVSTFASSPQEARAVSHLIQMNIVERKNGVLQAIANDPIRCSLVRYAARKLNPARPGNHGSVLFKTCDSETREKYEELHRQNEIRRKEIEKQSKPGPHKVAMVSFMTDLGDLTP